MTIRYCTVLLPFVLSPLVLGQTAVREDAAHRQWYIDAGRQTYAIGVNEQEMLQSLYWGPKLAANAQLPAARMHDARSSFDPPIGNTPLEYPAWERACSPRPHSRLTLRTVIARYC
jgi:alpha-galactosidase